MTADELAAIRERDASPDVLHHRCKAWGDRRALLAEVDRLAERVGVLERAGQAAVDEWAPESPWRGHLFDCDLLSEPAHPCNCGAAAREALRAVLADRATGRAGEGERRG